MHSDQDVSEELQRAEKRYFGGLTPAEAAQRSVATRKANDTYSDDPLRELEKAAYGRGRWKDLPSEKRLYALVKFLEYKIGRPLPRREGEDDSDGGEFTVGLNSAPPNG